MCQYGNWKSMLTLLTLVLFNGFKLSLGRPPHCKYDSLHPPRWTIVSPDWRGRAASKFGWPLNAAHADLHLWFLLNHLRFPRKIVLCASLECSTYVPSLHTRHPAYPFPAWPDINVYARKSFIVQGSIPRILKSLFSPGGSDMSTAGTPFHNFFNSWTRGCKKMSIVSSNGDFGLGLIIVKQMKKLFVSKYGGKLYKTIIIGQTKCLDDCKLWGLPPSRARPILMFLEFRLKLGKFSSMNLHCLLSTIDCIFLSCDLFLECHLICFASSRQEYILRSLVIKEKYLKTPSGILVEPSMYRVLWHFGHSWSSAFSFQYKVLPQSQQWIVSCDSPNFINIVFISYEVLGHSLSAGRTSCFKNIRISSKQWWLTENNVHKDMRMTMNYNLLVFDPGNNGCPDCWSKSSYSWIWSTQAK